MKHTMLAMALFYFGVYVGYWLYDREGLVARFDSEGKLCCIGQCVCVP